MCCFCCVFFFFFLRVFAGSEMQQPCPEFELWLPIPFSMTVMLSVPTAINNIEVQLVEQLVHLTTFPLRQKEVGVQV